MTNILASERKSLLSEKYYEFSFHDKQPDKQYFTTIDNSFEYHYIADIYNWDNGAEVLVWIANSNICDQGTAKMIFWRAQPSYYTRFLNDEVAEYDSEIFSLVRMIITNFENNFYQKQEIFYDPCNDPLAEDIFYKDPMAKWEIPAFMAKKSEGVKLEF